MRVFVLRRGQARASNPTDAARSGTPPRPVSEVSLSEDERIPAQAVLSIRALVREQQTAPFIARALQDVLAYMQEHDLAPTGPPFSICRPSGSRIMDVEAGWPIGEHAAGTPRIHCRDLLARQSAGSSSPGQQRFTV